jgi:hypothetical protein
MIFFTAFPVVDTWWSKLSVEGKFEVVRGTGSVLKFDEATDPSPDNTVSLVLFLSVGVAGPENELASKLPVPFL